MHFLTINEKNRILIFSLFDAVTPKKIFSNNFSMSIIKILQNFEAVWNQPPSAEMHCFTYIQLDKRWDSIKVSDVNPSALHHCRVEDMRWRLCQPCGSSQTAPCVAAASQGPNSGARLRPPHRETNPRRSVGTSCLTGLMTLRGETPVWVTYSPVTHFPSDGWVTVHMKPRRLRPSDACSVYFC